MELQATGRIESIGARWEDTAEAALTRRNYEVVARGGTADYQGWGTLLGRLLDWAEDTEAERELRAMAKTDPNAWSVLADAVAARGGHLLVGHALVGVAPGAGAVGPRDDRPQVTKEFDGLGELFTTEAEARSRFESSKGW